MESFGDSNCHSRSDSFSLYERYMRSFNVVSSVVEENDPGHISNTEYESSCEGNIELTVNKHFNRADFCTPLNPVSEVIEKGSVSFDAESCVKAEDTNFTSPVSLIDNFSATADNSHLTEKSNPTDVPVSSDDSKSNYFKTPVFITSTMENSNNAVDSVPLFREVRPSDSVFKLPIRELSFNGTIKHVQKLKPIVDPITALNSSAGLANLDYKSSEQSSDSNSTCESNQKNSSFDGTDQSNSADARINKVSESTGDSQYEEINQPKGPLLVNDDGNSKWNLEQSYSSLEASFDSGVRSPDMFSDEEEAQVQEPFWSFLKDFELYDKRRVRKLEVSRCISNKCNIQKLHCCVLIGQSTHNNDIYVYYIIKIMYVLCST